MDKKEIVFSTLAGLATIFIGYVVWKHEMVVGAENAQANLDAQQQQVDELQSAIAALPTSGSYGGGSSQQSYYGSNVPDTGSSSLNSPAGYSSDLDKILSAFYPTTVTTPAPATGTGAPADGTTAQVSNVGTNYNMLLPTVLPAYTPPPTPSLYASH